MDRTQLLLFEPELRNFGGHYNRDMRVLGAEARRAGVSLVVAARKDVEAGVRSALEALGVRVLPVFDIAPYRLPADRAKTEAAVRNMAGAALSCFQQFPGARPAWPSGRGLTLAASCRFAAEARVPFVTRMLDFSGDWPPGRLSAPAWLRDEVARACVHGLRLHAETPFIAAQLAEEIGAPVGVLSAVLDTAQPGPPADRTGGRPVVGFMNILRGSKNTEASLAALTAHADGVALVLHMGQGTLTGLRAEFRALGRSVLEWAGVRPPMAGSTPAAFRRHVGRLLRRHGIRDPRITIVPGMLDAAQYLALWRGLDCSVMPYDVGRFARQGSAMLFESLSDGIIPIAPEGTAMAVMMREAGVGITYDPAAPSGLANAIGTLRTGFDGLRARSRAYAGVYRAANTPARILTSLLEP